ncbi:MAG: cation:proton antiporter [Syntrophobacterales bacterium]|jgi:Kef-type K+ transport system membrane component KefB/Trk K+ transport system NAD-binding subunit|nr:cation:proton antiporter [Syntrophobacterales bacterium]
MWSRLRLPLAWCLGVAAVLALPDAAWASGDPGGLGLLSAIGVSIIAATVLAYLAYLTKQPLLLAYIAAGAVIGPKFGFGWVQSEADIRTIAHIGLILLLFMIGLELDLKKLKESGKDLITTGVLQFVLCAALGLGFFMLLGFTIGEPYEYRIFGVKVLGGEYDLLYLAVCMALSSTTIVVKLLYEKFELDTLAGRLTLGVLVFQDIWAIVVLSIQSSLANPQLLAILQDFAEAGLVVVISLALSKYVLGYVFRKIARLPELVLVASLGWCFLIAGLAGEFGLSMEMGALIAGVAISTFPYNLDIIAKIVSIRDFFITLFFVALGMAIPNPLDNLGMFLVAGAAALFLVASRFLSVYPILYFLKNGNRVSLLTSINLSQLSEFALVITVIGVKEKHIVPDIQTIITFVFVMTSVASTYMIKFSNPLQKVLGRGLAAIGFKDLVSAPPETAKEPKDIALLGFFRVASALLREVEDAAPDLKDKMLVVDFNPGVLQKLPEHGVKVVYGDISNPETLHHADLEEAKIVISTIPDEILVGTNNQRLIDTIKKMAPEARIIVTAESPLRALRLYEAGADYVYLPNQLAARHLLEVVARLFRGEEVVLQEEEMARLAERDEVIG